MLEPIIGGYGTPKFRGENFRGWLYNREICECFLPRKFSTIQYIANIKYETPFITLVPDSIPVLFTLVLDVHLLGMDLVYLFADLSHLMVLLLDFSPQGIRRLQLLQAVLKGLQDQKKKKSC